MKTRTILAAIAAVVVLFIAIALTGNARAAQVEVGAGITQYSLVRNGTWYQVGAPGNKLAQNSQMYLVGITDEYRVTDHLGVAWHADYVNLGHARSYCECTTIDGDYNHSTHAMSAHAPLASYSGNGMIQGIKLSLAPYYVIGRYRIGIEGGWIYYRPTWTERVTGWSLTGRAPYASAVLHTPDSPAWGGYLGAFVKHGRWSLAYGYYRTPVHQNQKAIPPLYTGDQVLAVSYAF